MPTRPDPHAPDHLDQKSVRDELTRVFDVCNECRRCVDLCGAFPTLFDLVERLGDQGAGEFTPDQQDRIVDHCFQCKRCAIDCPYRPDRHELAVDVPRLMLRAHAMRTDVGQVPIRDRVTTRVLGRTDVVGRIATSSSVARSLTNAPAGSRRRSLIARATGVSSQRLLPPFAKQRFSTWFARRTPAPNGERRSGVTVFPTCTVEYHETGIGKDLVRVYERNGVECSISRVGCCGAPWLHAGEAARFAEVAERNVRLLAAEIRQHGEVVVPQPTCSYVLRNDYVDHVAPEHLADAELVAEHTHDAAEHLVDLHRDGALDTTCAGPVPHLVTYHLACHLRAQELEVTGADLLELFGAQVEVVRQCSGTDGTWGLRTAHESEAVAIAVRLGGEIERMGTDAVVGDCHLANTAIAEQTGAVPSHPLQIVARAYGIPVDD